MRSTTEVPGICALRLVATKTCRRRDDWVEDILTRVADQLVDLDEAWDALWEMMQDRDTVRGYSQDQWDRMHGKGSAEDMLRDER